MNFFVKNLFILILFFSCDAFGRMEAARKLVIRTLNENPTKKNVDQLEKNMKSFIEEIYENNRDNFLEGSVIKVVREMVDDPSLDDINFSAALYSVSIKALVRDEYPRDPYFYLLTEFTLALKSNPPSRAFELADIVSSPYFRLPSQNDFNDYRVTVFEYVSENFDYIHKRGRSKAILLKWWGQEDFRKIVFPSIQKEQLDDSGFLLKWREEDRKMGTEKLRTFLVPYFGKVHRGEPIDVEDIFWQTVLDAFRESESFSREMNYLFKQTEKPLIDWIPGMIRGLPPERAQAISPRELMELDFEQIQAFTKEQVDSFNPQQRRALLRVYINH